MDIAQEKLGTEGEFDLKLVEGKLVLKASHKHASGHASLELVQDPEYFLDKLAAVIPGKVDDAIFAILKGALKGV